MAMDEFRSGAPSSNPGNYDAVPRPARPRNSWALWLILLLVVLAGIYWLGTHATSNMLQSGQNGTTETIAPGTTITKAPEGKVINGFPSELILEGDATASQSYSITYAENQTSQPVVTYVSKKTMQDNIDAYGSYLSLNGWDITQTADPKAMAPFFYATKDNADVNITFASTTNGVQVTIAYAQHQ